MHRSGADISQGRIRTRLHIRAQPGLLRRRTTVTGRSPLCSGRCDWFGAATMVTVQQDHGQPVLSALKQTATTTKGPSTGPFSLLRQTHASSSERVPASKPARAGAAKETVLRRSTNPGPKDTQKHPCEADGGCLHVSGGSLSSDQHINTGWHVRQTCVFADVTTMETQALCWHAVASPMRACRIQKKCKAQKPKSRRDPSPETCTSPGDPDHQHTGRQSSMQKEGF
jgi:hypothetical protein